MDRKVATSTTKTELDKLVRLQAFDSSYFWGESYFEKEGTQNYLVFQLMYIYFKNIIGVANGNYVCFRYLKVCLMNILIILLHLVTVLLQSQVILELKKEWNSLKIV